MRKFRTDHAPDAVFSVKGSTFRTVNHVFETDDKDIAEFLSGNANFSEVKGETKEPVKKAEKDDK